MSQATATKTWTEDEISEAVNGGRDLVMETIDSGERDGDLANLIVNAIMTRLRKPEATFDDVAEECYSESAAEILGWWTAWT